MSDGRPGRRHDLWDDDEQETPRAASANERSGSAARSKGAAAAAAGPAPSGRSRREQESSTRRWLVPVAILLVLALCGGGAWAALGGGGDDTACEGDPLTVAATPEIADALEDALAKVRESDSCANFDISSTSAADAAKNINDGDGPDVWVPDSSTWIDAVDPAKTTGQWLEGSSIASAPMDDARAASPASEAGTADELLDRLLQCDAQLVELLRTASRAMLALSDESPATSSEDDMTQWFATLHVRMAPSSRQDIQITLRHAAHALRQARLPPVLSPAAAQARLRGEVGVAGLSHTQTSSAPYSLSTLRLRECAWRRVAESLARAHHDTQAPLVASLARGASLASDT